MLAGEALRRRGCAMSTPSTVREEVLSSLANSSEYPGESKLAERGMVHLRKATATDTQLEHHTVK